MKRLLLILLIFISLNINAQNDFFKIKEGSFTHIVNAVMDDAEEHTDVDDKPMALLKISTENINDEERHKLYFTGNRVTEISDKIYKTGSVWIYITAEHSDFLEIRHPDYGVTRFYFPESLCDFCTYEMVLQYVPMENLDAQTPLHQNNTVTIIADQEDAVIYVDNEVINDNICVKSFPVGSTHTWKIECDLYHSEEGVVNITDVEPVVIERKLRKAHGFINVASTPENDAIVYLNDYEVGVTPYKSDRIASGSYKLKIKKEAYKTIERDIEITDGDTTYLVFNMQINYASVTINTDSQSEIYIDGEYKAKGNWTGNLLEGKHVVESKKAHHKTITKNVDIVAGKTKNITFEPPAFIHENMEVNTDATGTINGYEYVDLGLPSGVKWATKNIGASSFDKSGEYFLWGIGRYDIAENSSWEIDYIEKLRKAEERDEYRKNNININIEGKRRYDISRSLLGKPWRLPSKNDFQELINECTWIWVEQDDINGYRVVGPNSNSIFLPAAGFKSYPQRYNYRKVPYPFGEKGYYWTSVPSVYGIYALCFDNISRSVEAPDDKYKFNGQDSYFYNVRPVFGGNSKYRNDSVYNIKEMVIATDNDGDSIYINDNYVGVSPYIAFLPYGNYKIRAVREDPTNCYVSNEVSKSVKISKKRGYFVRLKFKAKKDLERQCVIVLSLVIVIVVPSVFVLRKFNNRKKQQEKDLELNGSINGHDYVDLGLPSGLKWATCNIGANNPEDFGDYYAWGETKTKSSYTDSNSLTMGQQMCDISGDVQYDVATVNWGTSWRMPTKTEMLELRDKCTWKWTMKNGVKGYMIKGLNSNTIFLPAVGCCKESSLYGAGEYGDFWGSTPCANNYAYGFFLGNGAQNVDWFSRINGRSIRPVTE